MKKILSLLLALVFTLVCLTSCTTVSDTEKLSDETSSQSEATTDTSETSDGQTEKSNDVYTFTATVLEVWSAKALVVETDDENMLRCADQFEISLPDGVVSEDFAIGDIVEIDFRYPFLEVYPARIPNVLDVRHIVRKTTNLDITVKVTAIDGDIYTVMGLTEGYQREFQIIRENENWEIGEELYVRYQYRGGYSEEYPKILDGGITKVDPDPVYLRARILSISGNGFVIKDFDKVNRFHGTVSFSEEDVNIADFQAGDYVEIGHTCAIPDISHPRITGDSMRHLTEEEIAELDIQTQERTVVLQYMGQDENVVTCISGNTVHKISVQDIEAISPLQYGDYIAVIYDGTVDYISAVDYPFVIEVYRCDRNGNRLE